MAKGFLEATFARPSSTIGELKVISPNDNMHLFEGY